MKSKAFPVRVNSLQGSLPDIDVLTMVRRHSFWLSLRGTSKAGSPELIIPDRPP